MKLVWALTLQCQEQTAEALDILTTVFNYTESEKYLRIFIDEGEPMIELLQQAARCGINPGYVGKLLAAFEATCREVEKMESAPRHPEETLNEREIEVLRLFAAGLTNADIARRLFISQNTVKWYAKNIYRKLDVHSRAEALARAYEMNLLSQ